MNVQQINKLISGKDTVTMIDNKKQDLITTKKHHTAKGFRHDESFKIKISEFLRWRFERKVLPPKEGYHNFNQTWFEQINLDFPDDRVWWIGHSTTLIRLGGKMILTDPIFSKRASPLQLIGPKRRTPPALEIEQLPQIDFIVISHNHYDHLDYHSIRKLIACFPNIVIMAPLGLKKALLKLGAKQITELDWWDSVTVDGLTFSATSAIHWSNRGLFDVNKALWCGWVIQSNIDNQDQSKTVYFMGDTCYSAELKEIAKRFPSIDLALIPIGAYAPRWYMQSQHIDPKQAVQLYDELNCHCAIAIHWGAFELADEPLDEPPQLLIEHKAERAFHLLKIGGNLAIKRINYELK
ncbi:MBL fold metallo-hydrolase [Gilliamella bombi]|uniref:MBL fold metallo-hydrolase n=1 Tax=Gilliamella bombi TaxID=1908521 RepID=UPI001ABFC0B9|nr:MBL fold metallo-hydrolase [Gilliamella bombi]